MQRRNSTQPSTSRSVSVSSGRHSDVFLPLVICPNCSVYVTRLVSSTVANCGRVFYKCPNQFQDSPNCQFWMWEEDYEVFLEKIWVQKGSGELGNLISVLKNEMEALNKEVSLLIQILKKQMEQSHFTEFLKKEMEQSKKEKSGLIGILIGIVILAMITMLFA